MRKFYCFVFLFGCLGVSFFSACASAPKDNFRNLEVGMEKVDVIELLGSPRSTYQANGKEIWRYSFYEGHEESVKEVVFTNGKVVTFGTPAISDDHEIEEMQSIEELKIKSRKKMAPINYKEI